MVTIGQQVLGFGYVVVQQIRNLFNDTQGTQCGLDALRTLEAR
jgi:hypothetical protein